ncbi:unnamed protein product [Caenorhabditis bovis]|uniref:ZP domain-containing protein n=1 Tax=Caenorhabditis bovis TaxID=2654633 RepID=A0A8S1EY80_9PELO|nr:unnamed protein product [Caenorhabditis bovis]
MCLFLEIRAEFEADVRWTCSDETVSIFVRTPLPFDGLVETRANPAQSTRCRVQGFGTNVAVLKLKLASDECGMRYNSTTKTYSVTIDVHSHPVLIVDGDKSLEIVCRENQNDTRSPIDEPTSDYELRVLSSRLPVDVVNYSQPYTLQVRRRRPTSSSSSFYVGKCTAEPIGGNVTVQLTDSIGCALFKSIMGDFKRREFVEEADVPSMFKFPAASELRIACVVTSCDGVECERRSCRDSASTSTLLERTTASIETDDVQTATIVVGLQKRRRETTATTSTPAIPQVGLIRKDDSMVAAAAPSSHECVSEFEFKLLYYLCIFLAVASIIGFTMNIILCVMLRRRRTQKPKKRHVPASHQLQLPKGANKPPDFWIVEEAADIAPGVYGPRGDSLLSYQPKAHMTRRLPSEYVIPALSRHSASSNDGTDIYRRPNIDLNHAEARHSSNTFLTHSTTMETDIDSQASSTNQASSYH